MNSEEDTRDNVVEREREKRERRGKENGERKRERGTKIERTVIKREKEWILKKKRGIERQSPEY